MATFRFIRIVTFWYRACHQLAKSWFMRERSFWIFYYLINPYK
ncbi:hypothetical protein CGRA01v4_05986 [Colletotrichum graminicola]|nr:hypothetical protein CGRA01v4_05986 [Colletotrichum graminicola]